MPILAGFHVEGNDHLVLQALVAKILQIPEQEIEVDFVDAPGRGWQFVLGFVGNALMINSWPPGRASLDRRSAGKSAISAYAEASLRR